MCSNLETIHYERSRLLLFSKGVAMAQSEVSASSRENNITAGELILLIVRFECVVFVYLFVGAHF